MHLQFITLYYFKSHTFGYEPRKNFKNSVLSKVKVYFSFQENSKELEN